MKKSLLSLGLLAFAFQSYAQPAPRFTTINQSAGLIPPSYGISQIHTVNANTMWAVVYDGGGTTAGPTNSYVRTVPATGAVEFGSIFSAQNPGFSTANIHGITDQIALASTFAPAGPGGEVVRTTNGGLRWTRMTTAAQFAAPDGFNNLVYLADNTDGFAFGDPNGGGYEVLITTDGGLTWARNNSAGLTPVAAGEYGLTQSFFGRGRNVWAGGGVQGSGTGRVFRNGNAGQGAWSAADIPAPFAGTPTDFAFLADNLNGLAMNRVVTGGAVTGYNLAKTTDGGATWTVITPTPSAEFFYGGLDVASGKFISYGRNAFGTPNTSNQYGYSSSTDGINWTLVQGNFPMQSMDVLDGGPDNGKGFAGYFTNNMDGTGGIFKTTGVLPTRSSAVQKALSVHPNPSANGVFTLSLNGGLKAGTMVRVVDMLGREVYSRALSSSAISTQSMSVDLSQQTAGVYSLEIRTAEGNAQQKLVIQ